jgi:hypothetical protein
MNKAEAINGMIRAWEDARDELGISLITPHRIKSGGQNIKCVAFLPDFGSVNGVLVGVAFPPLFNTSRKLIRAAESLKAHCAFLNPEIYMRFDIDNFVDLLLDWGFFGESEKTPVFLMNRPSRRII